MLLLSIGQSLEASWSIWSQTRLATEQTAQLLAGRVAGDLSARFTARMDLVATLGRS